MRFEEILEQKGWLVYKTKGISMLPMLHENQDLVVVRAPEGRLKKYDVALYRRGDAYVLHRVIGVREGGYDIRGDNTYSIEKVPENAVIGVLSSFVREGKKYEVTDFSYRLYARIWNAIYPLRVLYRRCYHFAWMTARRLGIAPLLKKLLRW